MLEYITVESDCILNGNNLNIVDCSEHVDTGTCKC